MDYNRINGKNLYIKYILVTLNSLNSLILYPHTYLLLLLLELLEFTI